MIDWDSDKSLLLLNPRLPEGDQKAAQSLLSQFSTLKSHFWLATSGSSGQFKWVALSKEAILTSARSVNQHLQVHFNDCWIHALPDFHVGGLGIWARAFCAGIPVVDYKAKHEKWDPHQFCDAIKTNKATLSALVPTQIYDLIHANFSAPRSLKAIIVGGGKLGESLYLKARALGWPLLPSYGMTECASQIATASLGSLNRSETPSLQLLSHIEAKIDDQKTLWIKSAALFSGYALQQQDRSFTFIDPKVQGWFQTEDLAALEKSDLQILGRPGHFVKIGGESVDLLRLEDILEQLQLDLHSKLDIALLAVPDERLGHAIHLATAHPHKETEGVVTAFNNAVLPFERIRKIHSVDTIPRSALQKVQRPQLLQKIQK